MEAWVKASANSVLTALFEPPCAACKAPLSSPLDGSVCALCWAKIRPSGSLDEHFDAGRALTWLSAVGNYDGTMKEIIHALKYDRRRSISPRLGAMMREHGTALLQDADCVVPVPLHPLREYTRGFNQAHDLAIQLGPPVIPLLKRIVHTHSQIDLPRSERLKNVRDAFALDKPFLSAVARGAKVAGLSIVVLVDDVSTTGATLESCARVLKAAGVKEVRAVTAARVVNERR